MMCMPGHACSNDLLHAAHMCAGAALAGALAAYVLRQDSLDEPLVPEAVTAALQEQAERAAEGAAAAVGEQLEEGTHLVNWSNTHECRPKRFAQPETVEELEAIVADAHAKGASISCTVQWHACMRTLKQHACRSAAPLKSSLKGRVPHSPVCPGEKLRVMGSGLSPNGLPFSDEGILSLALLDRQAALLCCHALCKGTKRYLASHIPLLWQGEVRGPAAAAHHSRGRHPRGAGGAALPCSMLHACMLHLFLVCSLSDVLCCSAACHLMSACPLRRSWWRSCASTA